MKFADPQQATIFTKSIEITQILKKFYKVIVNIININTNMQANAYLSEDGKKVFWISRTNVHRESKKQDTKLLAITSPTIPIFKFFH